MQAAITSENQMENVGVYPRLTQIIQRRISTAVVIANAVKISLVCGTFIGISLTFSICKQSKHEGIN